MINAWKTQLKRIVITAITLTVVFALSLEFCSCSNSHYTTGTEKATDPASENENMSTNAIPRNMPEQPEPEMYADPRWPTTNPELLAIPEEQRWYNAWGSVETTCTIVGPVVDVYQAKDEYGMPIFVTIGIDYPSSNSVTLVVWADEEAAYDSTLHAIDHGNAWLSVTSYLTVYNGYLQFSSDNYVEWAYWTGVS